MGKITLTDIDAIPNHKKMADAIIANMEQAMIQAVQLTTDNVKESLRASILRPNESDGTLENAVHGEVVKEGGHLIGGIGKIEKMDKEAPYWRVQDSGSAHMVGKFVPGFFIDQGGNQVPFDSARMPHSYRTTATKKSMDSFIFMRQYRGTLNYGEGMWITTPIRPKHFFEAGRLKSEQKVHSFFDEGFKRAFK